jgi:hypothetical protein
VAKGDHLVLHRLTYTHHGIDMGDETVVHYTGRPFQRNATAKVERCSFREFGGDVKPEVIPHNANPDLVVQRALSRLGETQYNLLTNNCEHFTRWCIEGEARSPQVRNASVMGIVAAFTGLAFWASSRKKKQ